MEYIFEESSLLQVSEVKIISELFNHEYIKAEISRFKFPSIYPYVEEIGKLPEMSDEFKIEIIKNNIIENAIITSKLKEKISALTIPITLKENLKSLINSLLMEVRKWSFHHKDFVKKMPNKLCCTPRRTVDNKQTAELIIKDENEDIETRYKMACIYCFEAEIPILWKRIPETQQTRFNLLQSNFQRETSICFDPRNYNKDLLLFWTYKITDKVTQLQELIEKTLGSNVSLHRFAFTCSILGLNRSATEFFFEKLSREEKDKYLTDCAKLMLKGKGFLGSKIETVFYLLNQMSEEQQETVFSSKIVDVLEGMLYWPYQTFFLKTAKKWLHYVVNYKALDRLSGLFDLICGKIKRREMDYNYKELFLELYQLCSGKYNIFQNPCIFWNVIMLHEAQEGQLAKCVLEQATDFQKQQLFNFKNSNEVPCHLTLVIFKEKWNFFKFIMDECITSKEIAINLKETIELQHSREAFGSSKVMLVKALQLVENFILKWD